MYIYMASAQHLHHHYQYILCRCVRMHLIPERYLSFKPEECFKLTTVHNIQQKRVVLQQQSTWLSLDIRTNQVVHICYWHETNRRMSGLQKPSIAWKLDAFHTLKIIWLQAVSTNLWIWWFMKPMVWCVNTVPPREWKLHSTVIIAGDMIDDWLDDRIIEPEEQGVVAEAVNPPPVEYVWPNGAGIFLEHEAAIAINVTNAPCIVLHVVWCNGLVNLVCANEHQMTAVSWTSDKPAPIGWYDSRSWNHEGQCICVCYNNSNWRPKGQK